MNFNDETVVRPDMMVICDDVLSDFLEFSPILIVEVIAPSSFKKDCVIKFDLYCEIGVRYFLLLNYTKKTVEVLSLLIIFANK